MILSENRFTLFGIMRRRCGRKLELIEKFFQARSKAGAIRIVATAHGHARDQPASLLASATQWRNTRVVAGTNRPKSSTGGYA
jgi:hypothetical protein